MAYVLFETLVGAVDGVNRTFETTRSYVAGSVVVFLNGLALNIASDDWAELGGKKIRMKVAPRDTDRVQAFYDSV